MIFRDELYEKLGTASAAALVDARRSEVFDADVSQQETRNWPAETASVA